MNLASGFLVHRRNKEIMRDNNFSLRIMVQAKFSVSGSFLFIYCIPSALLLMAVIYEFANIDVWLHISPYIVSSRNTTAIIRETPMWPFLTRAFMELLLSVICSAWILVPKLSAIYKTQIKKPNNKIKAVSVAQLPSHSLAGTNNVSSRSSNKAYSTVSYQSVRQPTNIKAHMKPQHNSAIVLKHHANTSFGHNKIPQKHSARIYMNSMGKSGANSFHRYGDETIL